MNKKEIEDERIKIINKYIPYNTLDPNLSSNPAFLDRFNRFINNGNIDGWEISSSVNSDMINSVITPASTGITVGLKRITRDRNNELVHELKLLEIYLNESNQIVVNNHSAILDGKSRLNELVSTQSIHNEEGSCYKYSKYSDYEIQLIGSDTLDNPLDNPLDLLSENRNTGRFIYLPNFEGSRVQDVVLPGEFNNPNVAIYTPGKDSKGKISSLKVKMGGTKPDAKGNTMFRRMNQKKAYTIPIEEGMDSISWMDGIDDILQQRGIVKEDNFRQIYKKMSGRGRISHAVQAIRKIFSHKAKQSDRTDGTQK